MRSARVYKKTKKTTVQLTSLLDLLFVMIFVSLIQQKTTSSVEKVKPKKEVPPIAQEVPVKIEKPAPEAPKAFRVSAVFSFYGTPGNPNVPAGSYNMQGVFDERTRELNLGGVSWNQRPENYDMVPLTGKIEGTNTLFKGKVDSPGCRMFTLRRTSTLSNSPISGTWQGVYDCSQGPTGLTLTVE